MSYRKPLLWLSAFMVLSIVLTWLVSSTLLRTVSGATDTYSAVFTDISGLHVGDDVRVAGIRVGRVESLDLQGDLARVTFEVQRDQTLYTDTTASVTYQNIIGQRYLGLAPGTSTQRTVLPRHGQIPVERTEPSFDITYLLRGFEPLFTLLHPKQVDDLTNGLIQALQGNTGSLLSVITQTSALAELFTGPDQILGELIGNLNTVVTDLAQQNSNLQTVITQTRDVMVGLSARRQELVSSVGSIAKTVGRLATITANVQPDLHDLVTREPGFTGQLTGDARQRFAYLGTNIPAVLKGLARATQDGSYGAIYVCDVNVTVFAFLGRLIPSIVRHATPGNTINHSPICR